VDEYTRECLALEVGRSITRESGGFPGRGRPAAWRVDSPAERQRAGVHRQGDACLVGAGGRDDANTSSRGRRGRNGYAESFNSKVRDAFLATEAFSSELEARVQGRQWKQAYNHERPPVRWGIRRRRSMQSGVLARPPLRYARARHNGDELIRLSHRLDHKTGASQPRHHGVRLA